MRAKRSAFETARSATGPRLWTLTAIFARLGNLTFGGGNPTMAALERELVERRKWLDPGQYALSYSLARVTPGTNVLAFCAAAAWFLRGWRAAVAAVVAASLPSAAFAIAVTYGYETLKSNPLARGAITGALASAVGMMGAAAWQLVRPQLGPGRYTRTLLLAAGATALSLAFPASPIQVLGLAALAGFFWRPPSREPAPPETGAIDPRKKGRP